MGRKSAAQQQAEIFKRTIGERLRAQGAHTPVVVEQYQDRRAQLEVWQARFAAVVDRPSLAGVWTLSGYWRFVDEVGGPAAIVWDTSVGWNVTDHPLAHSPDPICLVRYDFDRSSPQGLHLNVHQPAPLFDRVHHVLPLGNGDLQWDAAVLLDWLLGEACTRDLSAGGWPG